MGLLVSSVIVGALVAAGLWLLTHAPMPSRDERPDSSDTALNPQ